jgi:hypothetical protein
MASLLNRTFAEWTEGLSSHESMIAIFERVRDIPYSLVPGLNDPVTGAEKLLTLRRGSCAPKHYLLGEMYRRLNLNVVYATFPFSWIMQEIAYSPELRELAARLPVGFHLACRVQIGCRWVLVDATWDRPLKKAGFPVNETWDGYSDTKCAVRPIRAQVRIADSRTLSNEPGRDPGEAGPCPIDGEKDHWELEDRHRYYLEKTMVYTAEDRELQAQFHEMFNAWLEKVRSTQQK